MYQQHFLLSQLFATVTFGFDLVSWQCKDRSRVLLCLVLSSIFYAVHFALLHAWSGAALAILAALRFFTARRYPENRLFVAAFVSATLALAFMTYAGAASLISCAGGVCGTLASFKSGSKELRVLMMLATSLWLIYNLCIWSPVGALLEASFLASNLVGYWRHCRHP